jgi:two-component system, sensor histidine kinase and response regulator
MESAEKMKILYIDDDPNNLNSFLASFRFDYNIFIADNTTKAYEYLKENPDINVVMADQRMPVTTGVEFFAAMKSQFPKPVRILSTGYADIEAVIDAVNLGSIFRYIKKPWNEEEIKYVINEAYKLYTNNSVASLKNAELQTAYEELGKFAHSVTHDLRGPLMSIMGAINIANSIDNIEEIRDIISMIEIAIKKLDEFIRSIHEYYSIKKGVIMYESVNFEHFIKDLMSFFQISQKIDGISVKYSVLQPELFESDIVSLKIILINLISNAFKYQRKDEPNKMVEVKIEVINNTAYIEVTDNGIGIQQKHIDKIFDMFYRVANEQPGSGFGLFNVKDALNKLNGRIEVFSELHKGSTFKLIIPGKQQD